MYITAKAAATAKTSKCFTMMNLSLCMRQHYTGATPSVAPRDSAMSIAKLHVPRWRIFGRSASTSAPVRCPGARRRQVPDVLLSERRAEPGRDGRSAHRQNVSTSLSLGPISRSTQQSHGAATIRTSPDLSGGRASLASSVSGPTDRHKSWRFAWATRTPAGSCCALEGSGSTQGSDATQGTHATASMP
jgi:hypothetical protein